MAQIVLRLFVLSNKVSLPVRDTTTTSAGVVLAFKTIDHERNGRFRKKKSATQPVREPSRKVDPVPTANGLQNAIVQVGSAFEHENAPCQCRVGHLLETRDGKKKDGRERVCAERERETQGVGDGEKQDHS